MTHNDKRELPPLPNPTLWSLVTGQISAYTAAQMREYALAALATVSTAPSEQEPVAQIVKHGLVNAPRLHMTMRQESAWKLAGMQQIDVYAAPIAQPVEQEPKPVAWSLAWPEDIRAGRVNAMTTFGSERKAVEYAAACAPSAVKVVPLYAAPVSAEAIRREALEQAAETLEAMIDNVGDAASYDNRDLYPEEVERMTTVVEGAKRIRALASQPAHKESGKCGNCDGTGRMVRDPDIGTDQECFACEGSGQLKFE